MVIQEDYLQKLPVVMAPRGSWCHDSDPEHVLRKEDRGPFPAEPRVPNLRADQSPLASLSNLAFLQNQAPKQEKNDWQRAGSPDVDCKKVSPPLDPKATEFQPRLRPFPEAKDKDPQDLTQASEEH
ncbi:hypothetical protein Y1Q_0017658 [Alligator mississippiensis]|uniref:Uncharacterized protein n=1 Tax=Alligator mississippiensis TaxID=8496 RepID=A0A151N0W5_ALLMI|nr:hypothetical protein Y1Q_0017658 [Alligator mississippiensis]